MLMAICSSSFRFRYWRGKGSGFGVVYYPFVHFAGMELLAVLGRECFMLEWEACMQKEEPTSPLAAKSKSFEVKEH